MLRFLWRGSWYGEPQGNEWGRRYPTAYQERAADAKAKEARLRAILTVQRRSIAVGQGLRVMPF
jgi:hypothetical protein